ncbi:MAG: hypothetical protein HXS48_00760, partial [Theionarchaea archaeon]|nr:hypothetical protein [Theionarchaea archaeon]
ESSVYRIIGSENIMYLAELQRILHTISRMLIEISCYLEEVVRFLRFEHRKVTKHGLMEDDEKTKGGT